MYRCELTPRGDVQWYLNNRPVPPTNVPQRVKDASPCQATRTATGALPVRTTTPSGDTYRCVKPNGSEVYYLNDKLIPKAQVPKGVLQQLADKCPAPRFIPAGANVRQRDIAELAPQQGKQVVVPPPQRGRRPPQKKLPPVPARPRGSQLQPQAQQVQA